MGNETILKPVECYHRGMAKLLIIDRRSLYGAFRNV